MTQQTIKVLVGAPLPTREGSGKVARAIECLVNLNVRRKFFTVVVGQPFPPASKTGRPPFPIATMLRIHFMPQWFGLSDPAMEEALHYMALFREFAQLDAGATRLPDESTILRFRHLLEANNMATHILATVNAKLIDRGLLLKAGTVVDATLIGSP